MAALIAERRQHATLSRTPAQQRDTATTTATPTTDIVPLRSRVDADVRDKPPRDIKVASATRQQKG
jgi:hypothetical protein